MLAYNIYGKCTGLAKSTRLVEIFSLKRWVVVDKETMAAQSRD